MENKKNITGTEQLVLNAIQKVYIEDLGIDGGKVTVANTNAKVYVDCEELIVKDSEIKNGCTAYNVFEQRQTPKYILKNVKADNLVCNDTALTHNPFSLYNFADNATVLIQNSVFDFNVDNSNVIRLSNYTNAENVTVHFKNVDWNYENGAGTDFSWAGLVIYQPAGKDNALTGDVAALKTWKFVFENCRYNGVKVDAINFGEHNQVIYLYNVNKSGACEDPALYELNVEFK